MSKNNKTNSNISNSDDTINLIEEIYSQKKLKVKSTSSKTGELRLSVEEQKGLMDGTITVQDIKNEREAKRLEREEKAAKWEATKAKNLERIKTAKIAAKKLKVHRLNVGFKELSRKPYDFYTDVHTKKSASDPKDTYEWFSTAGIYVFTSENGQKHYRYVHSPKSRKLSDGTWIQYVRTLTPEGVELAKNIEAELASK